MLCPGESSEHDKDGEALISPARHKHYVACQPICPLISPDGHRAEHNWRRSRRRSRRVTDQ